ncbi:MAG: hypothetical protein ACK4VV_14095 [Pseudomonas sp.]
MKVMILAAVALMLAGCAAPNISSDFDVGKAEQSGVVAGSITYDGTYGGYTVHVGSLDGESRYRISHGSSQTLNPLLAFGSENADPVLGKKGSAFVIELPAGEYVVHGWQIGVGPTNVYSNAPIDITFRVEPQQVIYLGNFDFLVTETFMRNPTKADVTLSDQYSRDEAAIRAVAPSLAGVQISRAMEEGMRVSSLGGRGNSKTTIVW